MERLFYTLIFGTMSLVIVQAMTSGLPCTTSSDCQSDECCVSLNHPRGKRSESRSTAPGTCHKLGTTGSRCLANSHFAHAFNGLYYECPCVSTHHCKGTGLHEVPLGEIGLCQANHTLFSAHFSHTLNMPCSSGSQCSTTECCVSDIRPIGKRSLSGGHCKPMGTSGSSCYVKGGSGKPTQMTYGCPCSTGLQCIGSGHYDIPLGEIGTCK